MADIKPSDHLNLFLIAGDIKTPARISLIACPPFFSQHNAPPLQYLQRDPLNFRCNLHDWQDVLLSFGRHQT